MTAVDNTYIANCLTYDPVTGNTGQAVNALILNNSGGQIWFEGNTTVTGIVTADTPVKIVGITAAVELKGFDTGAGATPTDNLLRYRGNETKTFLINVEIVGATTANNRTFKAIVFKNGVEYSPGTTKTDYQIAARQNEMSINTRISLIKDDEIEIYISNLDTTDDPTIDTLSVCITQV